MQVAAYASLRCGANVVYVDTTNSFSAQRVALVVGGIVGSKDRLQEARVQVGAAMKGIMRVRAFALPDLLAALHQIALHCSAAPQGGESDFAGRLRLVVVDSASALVTPVLGGGPNSQGHMLMSALSRTLKRLAAQHRLAVLVTNHTVSGPDGRPKPALGESWRSVPHMRCLLQRGGPPSDVLTATLLKPWSPARGPQAQFLVGRQGVQDLTECDTMRAMQ